jgi:hypothetical protein
MPALQINSSTINQSHRRTASHEIKVNYTISSSLENKLQKLKKRRHSSSNAEGFEEQMVANLRVFIDQMFVKSDLNLNNQKNFAVNEIIENNTLVVKGILKKETKKSGTKKSFRFNETVMIGETFGADEYQRNSGYVLHLTPDLARFIKKELNDFKLNEMIVHQESAHMTHLFPAI